VTTTADPKVPLNEIHEDIRVSFQLRRDRESDKEGEDEDGDELDREETVESDSSIGPDGTPQKERRMKKLKGRSFVKIDITKKGITEDVMQVCLSVFLSLSLCLSVSLLYRLISSIEFIASNSKRTVYPHKYIYFPQELQLILISNFRNGEENSYSFCLSNWSGIQNLLGRR
jgi:hypothetical protein